MQEKTLCIILAGSTGPGLEPLTQNRALPAIPFGGKYRIIDFPLANCLHSGLRRILVLTQYKSFSLQKHLRDGWSIFNPELGEYITPVPPQMRTGESWYSGTADSVYQNLYLLERSGASWVLILSGDNVYRMDYEALINSHKENAAGVTLACMDYPSTDTTELSSLSVDQQMKVTAYQYKSTASKNVGVESRLTSMGVFLFSIDVLMDVLQQDAKSPDSQHDIEQDVIPRLVEEQQAFVYRFGGDEGRVTPDRYWREVNTLDSYYQANMDLLKTISPIDLYQPDWPIHTYQGQFPPSRTVPGEEGSEGIVINSITASGVVVTGGSVQNSILYPQVLVDDEAIIHDSILFNDVKVGKGVHLQQCIIDKDVVIPDGEQIGVDIQKDRERFTLSENGVVVVPKGYEFT